ncbi:MAG: CPBP family intramembrane metalloprotease [Anaerolineales bacterium]|nr:CPBP family intramembrane metalloprotease [Anaerolineales bacterium]
MIDVDMHTDNSSQSLKPLNLGGSALLFGIPAIILVLSYYIFTPWIESKGMPPFQAYLTATALPLALMLAAAIFAYTRIERNPLNRAAFAKRMRYPKLRWRDVLWGIGITISGMIGIAVFGGVSRYLIGAGLIPLSDRIPAALNPLINSNDPAVLAELTGGALKGNWGLVALYAVTFFFNIVGEELWWRGYILPRQELIHGRWTWVIHGVMWCLFHVFKYWDLLSLLPVCLLIAFSAQRLKSNWAGLIAHALINGLGVLGILLLVVGVAP